MATDINFFYPFASTPCFLLGSAGPFPRQKCQWAHPDKTFSPIRYYRAEEKATLVGGRDRLIVCCVHGSAFDPLAGGLVEQGPAEIPLALISLDWDQGTDQLFATGLLGLDSFDRFFRGFKGKSRTLVEGQTAVMRLREYSAAVARC